MRRIEEKNGQNRRLSMKEDRNEQNIRKRRIEDRNERSRKEEKKIKEYTE